MESKKWKDIDSKRQNARNCMFFSISALIWGIILIIVWSLDNNIDDGPLIVMLVSPTPQKIFSPTHYPFIPQSLSISRISLKK